jgi:hypothetical protein
VFQPAAWVVLTRQVLPDEWAAWFMAALFCRTTGLKASIVAKRERQKPGKPAGIQYGTDDALENHIF